MTIQPTTGARANGGGTMNNIGENKESKLPKIEAKKLPRPSERAKKLKTGTQKTMELDKASLLQKKGMRAANLAVQNSAEESGKGTTAKTFG